MAVNKRAEAEDVLQKLARYNGVKIDRRILKQVILGWNTCPTTPHYGMIQMFILLRFHFGISCHVVYDKVMVGPGLILGLRPANKSRRYKVTPSFTGCMDANLETALRACFWALKWLFVKFYLVKMSYLFVPTNWYFLLPWTKRHLSSVYACVFQNVYELLSLKISMLNEHIFQCMFQIF